ncbi:hypothetical protein KSW81_002277 [Nannochloris sp. 'desiccata']|nr:hypothetical protein KSW81_002277 [Chlorella desiccata (nom. nud.)]
MDDNPVHLCSYLTNTNLPPITAPGAPSRRPLFTVYQGPQTSAEEACIRVLRFASSFSRELKLLPGARVATLALTTPNHLETLLAITAAGCIAAPLNWRWSVSEARYAVDCIQATVICADDACLPLAKQVAELSPSVRMLVTLGATGDSGWSRCNSTMDGAISNKEESVRTNYRTVKAENLVHNSIPSTSPRNIFLNRSSNRTRTRLLQQPDDGAAFIIFTSGTTGPPRAAVLSHAALHFQCTAKLRCCHYTTSDIYLHTAQLFHVGGLCSALAMLLVGAQHVFLPIFRASECLKAIEMYNVTSFIAVPTMISDLIAVSGEGGEEKRKRKNFPLVRSVLVGAGGLSKFLITGLSELLPNATVYAAYGMTEACSSLTFSTLITKRTEQQQQQQGHYGSVQGGEVAQQSMPLEKNNSSAAGGDSAVYVGCPPPGIELAILPLSATTTTTQTVSSSSSALSSLSNIKIEQISHEGYGEVLTRGLHAMLRYWDDPEATSSSFLPDAFRNINVASTTGLWMRTGDLGHLKTGSSFGIKQQCLWLVGRAKDVIKSGGENVPAAEVERALLCHPAVAVAAVVGLPDSRLGERVAAAVVLNKGYTWQGPKAVYTVESTAIPSSSSSNSTCIHGSALQQHCRSVASLAGFKLPRTFFVFDTEEDIPRNATGKVFSEHHALRKASPLQANSSSSGNGSGGNATLWMSDLKRSILRTVAHIPCATKEDEAIAPAGQPHMPDVWPDFSATKIDPDIENSFFNRKEEYDMIIEHLNGAPKVSLLLLGPKNSGKSALLKSIIEKEKSRVIYLNCGRKDVSTPEFMAMELRNLARNFPSQLDMKFIKKKQITTAATSTEAVFKAVFEEFFPVDKATDLKAVIDTYDFLLQNIPPGQKKPVIVIEGYDANSRDDQVLGDLTSAEAFVYLCGGKVLNRNGVLEDWPGLIAQSKEIKTLALKMTPEDWKKVWSVCGGNIHLLKICVGYAKQSKSWEKGVAKTLSKPQMEVAEGLKRPELIPPPVGSDGPRIWERKHYKAVLRLIDANPYHAVRQEDAEAALEKVGGIPKNVTAAQVLLSMVEFNVLSLRPYSEMAEDIPREAFFKKVGRKEKQDNVVIMPSPAHLAAVLELDVELEERQVEIKSEQAVEGSSEANS